MSIQIKMRTGQLNSNFLVCYLRCQAHSAACYISQLRAKEQSRSDWNAGKGKLSSHPTLVRIHYWANLVMKVKILFSLTTTCFQYHYWNSLSGLGTWGIQPSEKSVLQQLTDTCWVNTLKAKYLIKLIIFNLCNSDIWICKRMQGHLFFLWSPCF